MKITDSITSRLVDDWRNAMKLARVWIAGGASAIFSAIAVGLSMSAAAKQWASIIPMWAVSSGCGYLRAGGGGAVAVGW